MLYKSHTEGDPSPWKERCCAQDRSSKSQNIQNIQNTTMTFLGASEINVKNADSGG